MMIPIQVLQVDPIKKVMKTRNPDSSVYDTVLMNACARMNIWYSTETGRREEGCHEFFS
jgi:hypothetical protein